MNTRIAKALSIASKGHEKQKRKYDGAPYLNHLLEVNSLLSMVKVDEDTIIAGLLHDAIEDTEITAQQIALTFGNNVEGIVTALSDDKALISDERHANALEKMITANAAVLNIKLADVISNMCAIPLDWSKSQRTKYLQKCSDVIDVITSNSSKKAPALLSLATLVLSMQTKEVALYTNLLNFALADKLYWSTTYRCFLYRPIKMSSGHECIKIESNFSQLFDLGLLHRLGLSDNKAIEIRETSFTDGDTDVVQNKQAILHKTCLKVQLQ